MARELGFFNVDERLHRLTDLGDQLEAYGRAVDFEIFRPELEAALCYSERAKGGRPPCDPVLMFVCGRSLRCKGFRDCHCWSGAFMCPACCRGA